MAKYELSLCAKLIFAGLILATSLIFAGICYKNLTSQYNITLNYICLESGAPFSLDNLRTLYDMNITEKTMLICTLVPSIVTMIGFVIHRSLRGFFIKVGVNLMILLSIFQFASFAVITRAFYSHYMDYV